MLDVFLEGRKQEVLENEGGELLQVELRHVLDEAHKAPSPVALERADRAVALNNVGIENDEESELASKAFAGRHDATHHVVAVEERKDTLANT